ncbi:MAG TPA: hypothetical protein VEJ87_04660 [Acidimicrobiales bacterium]|nr:hypothetical protein [Acidimicrobiales bacterium]
MFDAVQKTCRGDTQLLVCLDSDDASKYEPIPGVWYAIKEQRRLTAWLNDVARLYTADFRFFGSLGDDHLPVTMAWDIAVAKSLSNLGTGLCYGDDLLQGKNLPTACFMTSNIVQTLGYMCPPTLIHMYADNFWLELGGALERIQYMPDVVIEHLHPSKHKASRDAVYDASEALMKRDKIAFDTYMGEQFPKDVQKLRRSIALSSLERSRNQGEYGQSSNGLLRSRHRSESSKYLDTSKIPVLITCRDRLEPLQKLVAWLESAGHQRIVFVDNASTFEPLINFYETTPHQVLRLDENLGHLAAWRGNVLESIGHEGAYVVTDCDVVPDDDAPRDALNYFAELLFRYSDVEKVGFGLRIDDLPDSYRFKAEVIDWESQFWEVVAEPGVFRANIDTTFALYRPSARAGSFRALRTGPPYVARHLPWYKDSSNLSQEDTYYYDHALRGESNWDLTKLPQVLLDAIELRRGVLTSAISSAASPHGVEPALTSTLSTEHSDDIDVATFALSDQLDAERMARVQAEMELAAIRETRSYRWTRPARKLRTLIRGGGSGSGGLRLSSPEP